MRNKFSKLVLVASLIFLCQCASYVYRFPPETSAAFANKSGASPTEPMRELLAKAQEGDAAAQVEAGKIYREGRKDIPADYFKAYEWLHKASQQGNTEAMYQIGNMYHNGEIGPLDLMLYAGTRGPSNYNYSKATSWYLEAALLNYAKAQYALSQLSAERGFDDGHYVWLHKAAENGNGKAMVELFYIHVFGPKILDWDEEEGKKWFSKIVESGDPETLIELGRELLRGGGEQREEAIRLFRQAAEQGFAEAQYSLGVAYGKGEEAKTWLRKAGENGNAEMQYRVAETFARQLEDYAEAKIWFSRAAENGNALMRFNVGKKFYLAEKNWFESERVTALLPSSFGDIEAPKDPAEAFKWLYKAAAEGRSMVTPVNSYSSIHQNVVAPCDQWYLAANQLVGYMYREGIGVPQDKKEAEKWLVFDDKGPTKTRLTPYYERDKKLMEEWNARWKQISQP
jgi:TPR repeat protein